MNEKYNFRFIFPLSQRENSSTVLHGFENGYDMFVYPSLSTWPPVRSPESSPSKFACSSSWPDSAICGRMPCRWVVAGLTLSLTESWPKTASIFYAAWACVCVFECPRLVKIHPIPKTCACGVCNCLRLCVRKCKCDVASQRGGERGKDFFHSTCKAAVWGNKDSGWKIIQKK